MTTDAFFSITGVQPYDEALQVQRRLNSMVSVGTIEGCFIILEHEEVYTCGIHRDKSDVKTVSGIRMVERGGGITYHCPGQIVIYFILNLRKLGINVKELIGIVHGALIQYMNGLGIQGESRLGIETGIWVGNRKICSTGFAIRGDATFHGIALNYNNSLSGFLKIDPCGFSPEIMTSCKEIGNEKIPPLEEAKEMISRILCEKLSIKIDNKISWDMVVNISNGQLSQTVP